MISRKDGRNTAARHSAAPATPFGRQFHDGAEIGGEGEERTRNRLRCAIAGEERIIADPAGRHHRRLQQREDDVPAAEDQRSGPIEGVGQLHALHRPRRGEERQPDEQRKEGGEHRDAGRPPDLERQRDMIGRATIAQNGDTDDAAEQDGADLAPCRGQRRARSPRQRPQASPAGDPARACASCRAPPARRPRPRRPSGRAASRCRRCRRASPCHKRIGRAGWPTAG